MNFWGFLAIFVVVMGVLHLAINFMRHRQNMVKLKAWKLDSNKKDQ